MLKIGFVASPKMDLHNLVQRVAIRNRYNFGTTGLEYAPFDVIVIPDNVGIYVGLSTLVGMSLPGTPICPYAEYFRINLLPEYIDKETPIIGIGDGAAMLTPYTGVRVGVGSSGEPLFLKGDKIVSTFETELLLGVPNDSSPRIQEMLVDLMNMTRAELKAVAKGLDDSPDTALAPVVD